MKNVILSLSILTSFLAVSCKKENNVSPQTSTTGTTIHVEYRVQSESGNVEILYSQPNEDGVFETESETVNRTYYSINFDCKKGNYLMVEAANVLPARKTVHVSIYVNGNLFKEAFSYDPSQKAIASGNY